MSNPARIAFEVLQTWRARAVSNAGGAPALSSVRTQSEIVLLARALSDIERLIGELELDGVRVEAFREQLPEWWRGLTVPDYADSSGINPDGIIPKRQLTEIDVCASFLDFYIRALDGEDLTNLRELVHRAREALESDTALTPPLREYIHKLLREIQHALDDESIGATFDFAEAVLRLHVAFKAAESENTDSSSTWHALWTSIVSGTATGMLVAGGTIVLKAITEL